jgi:hypothetical protein
MNMLIGVLCEVVSGVASVEKEERDMIALKSKLAAVMDSLDTNGNGTLSEMEFVQLVSDEKAVKFLSEVGVDPIGLINMVPNIFDQEVDEDDHDEEAMTTRIDTGPKEISFEEFMEIVWDLRGSNAACLKDIRELKNDLVNEIGSLRAKLTFSNRLGKTGTFSDRGGGRARRRSLDLSRQSSSEWGLSEPLAANPSGVGELDHIGHTFSEPIWANSVDFRSPVSPASDHLLSPRCDARCGIDMQEVEKAFCTLQEALTKVHRPSSLGVAGTICDQNLLDWADRLGKTAISELEKLQMMQTSCSLDAPFVRQSSPFAQLNLDEQGQPSIVRQRTSANESSLDLAVTQTV